MNKPLRINTLFYPIKAIQIRVMQTYLKSFRGVSFNPSLDSSSNSRATETRYSIRVSRTNFFSC